MASTASGKVTNSQDGKTLTYTDTGSYSTIISRILTIYDANGVLLNTINMGATLVSTFGITADGYYTFICTVVDNTGTFTATVNFLAENIYIAAMLSFLAGLGCCNGCIPENVFIADLYAGGAEDSGSFGFGPQAQQQITAANTLINS